MEEQEPQENATAQEDQGTGQDVPTDPRDFIGGGGPNNLSRIMIAKGHALGVGMGAASFQEEQSRAQQRRLGIWQGPFQPPSAWRRR